MIRVTDAQGEVLLECPPEEQERAWEFCRRMEEMGVEVTLQIPGLPESLGLALGLSAEDRRHLREELEREIDAHI